MGRVARSVVATFAVGSLALSLTGGLPLAAPASAQQTSSDTEAAVSEHDPATDDGAQDGDATSPSDDAAFDRRAELPDADEVLVLPTGSRAAAVAALERAGADPTADLDPAALGGFLVAEVEPGTADEVVEALEDDPAVAVVQPNHRRRAFRVPNDHYWVDQVGSAELLRLPEAWDRTTGSSTQVLAVLDTGVDAGHPDLGGRVLAGRSFVGGSPRVDVDGHGTAVAGVAAATGNNARGLAGVSWNTRILPVKVLDDEGVGSDASVAAGVRWAADQNATVINLSLGGPAHSPVLDAAITYAVGRGAVVVAASGNDGDDTPMYPAAHPDVLAVGAVDQHGQLTYFSSWGEWVDLVAPGWGVLTLDAGPGGTSSPDSYLHADGTSFAAPYVAGAALLVRALEPTLTPAQVAQRLRGTARDVGPRGVDPYHGFGVLDVARALGAGTAPAIPPPAAEPSDTDDVLARARALPAAGATIAPHGDVDHWRYDHAGGGVLRITVTPPNPPGRWGHDRPTSFDPVVRVWSPTRRLLAEVDDADLSRPETVVVSAAPPGRYVVEVSNYNGSVDDGTYAITVEPLDWRSRVLFDGVPSGPVDGTPRSVAVGDLDGDGRLEAVVATTGGTTEEHQLLVYAPDAVGDPEVVLSGPSGTSLTSGTSGSQAGIALADLGGDGRDEVLQATRDGFDVFSLLDDQLVRVQQVTAPNLRQARHLAVGDVDGDGLLDVAVLRVGGVTVAMGEQEGGFRPETVITTSNPTSSWEVRVHDLDGDGRDELVVGTLSTVTVRARDGEDDQPWVSRASLTAVAPSSPGTTPSSITLRAVAVGDVTGDGRPDLLPLGGGSVTRYLNVFDQQVDGTFAAAPSTILSASSGDGLAVGDLDGDGDEDVAVVTDRSVSVHTQVDGRLTSSATHAMPVGGRVAEQKLAAVADLDRDGRLEVLVAKDRAFGLVSFHRYDEALLPAAWVVNVTPRVRATAIERDAVIDVELARQVAAASVDRDTVTLFDGQTGAVVPTTTTVAGGGTRLQVRPTSPMAAGRSYQLRIWGIEDVDGDELWWPWRSSLSTVAVPPAVKGSTTSPRLAGTALRPRVQVAWEAGSGRHRRTMVRIVEGRGAPSTTTGTLLLDGTATSVLTGDLVAGRDYTVALWSHDAATVRTYGSRVSRTFDGTRVTLTSPATRIRNGESVTLSGKLERVTAGTAVGGQALTLHHRPVGATSWSKVADLRTASNGTFSTSVKPTVHREYQVRYAGSGQVLGSISPRRTIRVQATVTSSLDRTSMTLGRTAVLSGKVSPAHAGHKVELQQLVSGSWKTVRTTNLSSTSTYRFSISPTKRATYEYRVRFPGDADHVAGVSPRRTLKVT